MDPHKNIFYYYRGPSQKDSDEIRYDRQIENNTTKSLINTLENSSDPKILKAFIGLVEQKANISLKEFHSGKSKFVLQQIPDTALHAKTKVVLIISNCPTVDEKAYGSVGGRPDAWMISPSKATALMFEVKMETPVSLKQINGHLDKCGWSHKTPIIKLSWAEIHKTFNAIKDSVAAAKNKFILNEFVKYLEVIGMSDFNGFMNDDFDFFISYDPEYKPIIRKKLKQLATKIYARLPKAIQKKYPDIHMGRIVSQDERWAWIVIRKDQNTADIFKQCNFSAELNKDALLINTVIRNGKHSDRKTPMGVLCRKIQQQKKTFINLLKQYKGDGISFVVYRRSDRPRPGYDPWTKISDISLEIVNEESVDYILSLLKSIKFPGIHICKKFPRGNALLKQPVNLVSEAAVIMAKMDKILEFLDGE